MIVIVTVAASSERESLINSSINGYMNNLILRKYWYPYKYFTLKNISL